MFLFPGRPLGHANSVKTKVVADKIDIRDHVGQFVFQPAAVRLARYRLALVDALDHTSGYSALRLPELLGELAEMLQIYGSRHWMPGIERPGGGRVSRVVKLMAC